MTYENFKVLPRRTEDKVLQHKIFKIAKDII